MKLGVRRKEVGICFDEIEIRPGLTYIPSHGMIYGGSEELRDSEVYADSFDIDKAKLLLAKKILMNFCISEDNVCPYGIFPSGE